MAARKKVKDLKARGNWVQEVKEFRVSFDQKDKDWVGTNALKRKIADHLAKNPGSGLTLELFNDIVKWKLDTQEGRTRHTRGPKVTEDLLREADSTKCESINLGEPLDRRIGGLSRLSDGSQEEHSQNDPQSHPCHQR